MVRGLLAHFHCGQNMTNIKPKGFEKINIFIIYCKELVEFGELRVPMKVLL